MLSKKRASVIHRLLVRLLFALNLYTNITCQNALSHGRDNFEFFPRCNWLCKRGLGTTRMEIWMATCGYKSD
jgi:hypothetical protein